ncbi:MAG: molybdenum cofactor biosynthesis protein MoaE [Desulfobacterales bacterium]|jgi:molybdopterin synthase catalytic subunit
MRLADLIEKIRQHPDYHNVGMILCHNGVVRKTSRDGRAVSGLRISVNHEKLNKILDENKQKPGIIDIKLYIAANQDLKVGDDVMFLVVAGDIRENVISCLQDTLNAIKIHATHKTQFYL